MMRPRSRFQPALPVLVLALLIACPQAAGLAAAGATITVSSTADSGAGTLRAALINAHHGDTIVFSPLVFPPSSPKTIALTSALPAITQGALTLDGSVAGVVIDGRGIVQDADCLALKSDGNTVRGLNVGGCAWTAISVWGASNTIAGNVLWGSGDGVGLWSAAAHDNLVIGNTIGPDPSASGRTGNARGVKIVQGAHDNTIGGANAAERNVIGGNAQDGVRIADLGTRGNIVIGNYVGLSSTGAAALPNSGNGIVIANGASNNVIGGGLPGQGNAVSGNLNNGIVIWDTGSDHNTVVGNIVGLNAAGAAVVGNGATGITVSNGAKYNTLGGDGPGERNVVSGNVNGVGIWESGTDYNTVLGNLVGTDVTGTAALGNQVGVVFSTGATRNTVGPGNLIMGNRGPGVQIAGAATARNKVTENSIHGNDGAGIELSDGANGGRAAPVISQARGMTASGTACPGCVVELFSDDAGEGLVFEGRATAQAGGAFSYTRTESFTGPLVTATATDSQGNTSTFSTGRSAPVLSIVPPEGSYGTRFVITGTGWGANELVSVESFWPDGTSMGKMTYTADGTGYLNPHDWVTSAGEPSGVYTWKAIGPVSGTVVKTFRLLPATEPILMLYPDEAVAGTIFYFGGAGFRPDEQVEVELAGPTPDALDVAADAAGNFTFEWSSAGHRWGTYTVRADGDQGSSASATLQVLPVCIYEPLQIRRHK